MSDMAVATRQQMGIRIQTLPELVQFSQMVVRAGWAPRGTTAEQAVIAMQMGMELGLSPMQALQNISVVNGRPAIWGDAMPGLIYASGLMVYYDEKIEQNAKNGLTYHVTVQRKGQPKPVTRNYSIAKAKRAGLWGKAGSWTTNPDRMLLIRARTFAFRDVFPDVLKGLTSVEEAMDTPAELQQAEVIEPKPKQLPSLDGFFSEPEATIEEEPTVEIPVVVEAETGPESDEPRPRRPYTRRNKPAEAAPVLPTTSLPHGDVPQESATQQEPPKPFSKRDELLSECRDIVFTMRERGVQAKLPPDAEEYSYDALLVLKKQLAAQMSMPK